MRPNVQFAELVVGEVDDAHRGDDQPALVGDRGAAEELVDA